MGLTDLLNIQALDFDIWGFHVKANFIMSIIMLIIITGCWIWNRYRISKLSQISAQYNYKLEQLKLDQAALEANRKKPTWCHVCDTNMVIDEINSAWGKVIGFKYPKCGLEKVHNNKAN